MIGVAKGLVGAFMPGWQQLKGSCWLRMWGADADFESLVHQDGDLPVAPSDTSIATLVNMTRAAVMADRTTASTGYFKGRHSVRVLLFAHPFGLFLYWDLLSLCKEMLDLGSSGKLKRHKNME